MTNKVIRQLEEERSALRSNLINREQALDKMAEHFLRARPEMKQVAVDSNALATRYILATIHSVEPALPLWKEKFETKESAWVES